MASAAPAYRYPERKPSRVPDVRPSIQVLPGSLAPGREAVLSPTILALAKILVAILVFSAILAFVRIGLASAAASTAVLSKSLSDQTESARALGKELEVRESYLSNLGNLKNEATQLGMASAVDVAALVLEKDIVATDEQGNLSLAQSLDVLAQNNAQQEQVISSTNTEGQAGQPGQTASGQDQDAGPRG
ncbi:MAG: hypothetical protein LBG81_05185 [Coriobacteriaceae bacterium]|jgi:hypothetical protein|nr:hypothetical protein [Coriobacteriaceae bacterium]